MKTTALELIEMARKAKPEIKYALNDTQTAIGAWSEADNRYKTVAFCDLSGNWYNMPFEVLADGKCIVENWIA
jgi:hypothetical protein